MSRLMKNSKYFNKYESNYDVKICFFLPFQFCFGRYCRSESQNNETNFLQKLATIV